ncbi:hypothetical protein [Streptomyces sp. B93]|uniref:hypothetical protein n=1 Tax=Streptomyces sp. B93 TaxID=2824875 RepID=UPI001B359C18|nr:hypothetical protein [Streptomyces sp. B93]MBQ1090138.1 hypothetical protein [Streptomyces sp. B93]
MAGTVVSSAQSGHALRGAPSTRRRMPAVPLSKPHAPLSAPPPETWPHLVARLRDPLIEEFSAACRELVAADADLCEISPRDFDIQLRLYAPSVLSAGHPGHSLETLYDALRRQLIVRCSRIAAYTHDADLMANTSLLIGGGEARRDFTVRRPDGSSVRVSFDQVPADIGHLYQSKLHYLLSPRADTLVEVGCYLQGASHPITYLGFSACDRPGIIEALRRHDVPAERSNLLVLTRALGLSDTARNLMSFTIGQAVRYVRDIGCKYIVTAFNPLLGFTGSALHASNFTPFATAPVAYFYDTLGNYRTRRQSASDKRAERRAGNYRNLLVALGTDSTTRREIRKVKTLEHLAEPTAQKPTPSGARPSLALADLWRYRSRLEAAWSVRTTHPSYAREPLSSKGQCGVSSVWLARRLRQQQIEATYCYGRLRFDDPGISSVDHHCWIEIGAASDPSRQVVDLTVDQADGYEEKVICRRFDELSRDGIHYEPTTRLSVDDLPKDRVWSRYTRLEESMREKWGIQTLYDSV